MRSLYVAMILKLLVPDLNAQTTMNITLLSTPAFVPFTEPWTEKLYTYNVDDIPYANVPFQDQDMNRPNKNDRNIFEETLAIRDKTLKDFDEYFEELKENFPEPNDIRLKKILDGMKAELTLNLETTIDRLNKTQHYPLKLKMAQLSEFQITALGTLQRIMTRWMQKYLEASSTYQRSFKDINTYVTGLSEPLNEFFETLRKNIERDDETKIEMKSNTENVQ